MSNNFFTAITRHEYGRLAIPLVLGAIAFVAGLWWLLRTDYVNLDAPLTDLTRNEALATLQNAGIEYHTTAEGQVQVPGEQLRQARTLLAQIGLAFPEPTGFELLDKAEYTLSDFSQRINFQRALEGELARTIMGLREVRSARVHLAIPKQELFSGAKNIAKASVTLQLKPGQVLSGESAGGIREIVASSVDTLKPENVAIIDDNGNPLAGNSLAGAAVAAGFDQRAKLSRHLELDLERRIRQLLQETWSIDGAYVSVRADLNFDRMSSIRDGAVPTTDAVGLLTREQISDGATTRDGQAGTSASTREYAYTHERVETEFASGKIERLSIAVALPSGNAALNLADLEKTVGAAIGLQPERGDKMVVSVAPALAGVSSIAAVPISAPASVSAVENVSEISELKPSPPAVLFGESLPATTFMLMALLATLVVVILVVLALRRKPAKASRMSVAQREQLLADLQKWVQG